MTTVVHPPLPAMDRPSMLFVVHQMGTLDHTISLYKQVTRAGAVAHLALGEPSLALPDWFTEELPELVLIDDPLQAIAERRYDALVMQMPYDDLKDPVWATIGREEAFVIYSAYGLGVQLIKWDHGVYGLPFFSRCSLILASSPHSLNRYLSSEFSPLSAFWSGDPLLYELARTEPASSDMPSILWAPHWSEKWVNGEPGFSTWKSTVHDVLSVARRNPSAQFIVRGHPLMKVGGDDRRSRRATRSYKALLRLPNVRLSTASMKQDILESTALLTDGISIIAYYSATGKPMAVVRRAMSWPPYNVTGKALVNQSDVVHDSRSIRAWLRAACHSHLDSSTERQELVAQLFPLHSESPGQLLFDELVEPAITTSGGQASLVM